MDERLESPVLRWLLEGFLYATSLYVAAIAALAVALELRHPGPVFVTFAVVLIAGLVLTHALTGKREDETQDQNTAQMWVVLGGLTGFVVCGAITAIVLRPF